MRKRESFLFFYCSCEGCIGCMQSPPPPPLHIFETREIEGREEKQMVTRQVGSALSSAHACVCVLLKTRLAAQMETPTKALPLSMSILVFCAPPAGIFDS